MSIHLIRDVEGLHRNLLTMCAQVEELIEAAVDALQTRDQQRALGLQSADDDIDEFDVQIEEDCLKILALHQPVAIDLRRIASVMKISGELERVADLGVSIAERTMGIVNSPEVSVPDKLKEMSRMALQMLHRSIDAYVHLDERLARQVLESDDRVDCLNREIIEELTDLMKRQPSLIDPAMHLFSASRQIERVGDHATNIAEDVIYLISGDIIRHRGRRGGRRENRTSRATWRTD